MRNASRRLVVDGGEGPAWRLAPEELVPRQLTVVARLLRKPELTFGEVVLLHLCGAASDRDAVSADHLMEDPPLDVGLLDHRLGAEQPRGQIGVAGLVSGNRDLDRRGVDGWLLAPADRREDAFGEQTENL